MFKEASTFVVRMFSRLPILGHLAYCTRRNHLEAAKEFAVVLIFSTATFWLTSLLLKAYAVNAEAKLSLLIYSTVDSGQLFIFAVGFLGPTIYAATSDPANAKLFPGRVSHAISLFFIGAIAASFYAIQLTGKSLSGVELNQEYLFATSFVIAVLAIILRYLTMVYRKNTMDFDPEDRMIAPANRFASNFIKMHKGSEG